MPRRRSTASLILRQLVFVALLALALAGGLVASGTIVLPYRYDPFARLDLEAPPDWLTGYRLRRLQGDPELCFAALDAARIGHRRIADREGPENCGLTGAVEIAADAAGLSGRATMTCGIAASWLMFERHELRAAARTHLGQELRQAQHLGTYACRRIAGSETRWSQHARANAIDISAFVLADGSRVSLSRDWTGEGREAAFLRAVRDGACRWFRTVLGPDYNAAHADHFHLDNGSFRICR